MICDYYPKFADFYLIQKFINEKYSECQFIESYQVFAAIDGDNKPIIFLPRYTGNPEDNNQDIISRKIQLAVSLKIKMKANLVCIKIYGNLIYVTDDCRDSHFFIDSLVH